MGWGSKPKTPPPTAAEIALAERGVNEWNRYVQAGIPAQDKFLKYTKANAADENSLVSAGVADAAKATGGVTDIVSADLAAGAGPSSGRSALSLSDAATGFATGKAGAKINARDALRRREHGGIMKALAGMRGLADDSRQGLITEGRINTQSAIDSMQRKTESRQSIVSALSSAAGMYAGHKGWLTPQAKDNTQNMSWITGSPRKLR